MSVLVVVFKVHVQCGAKLFVSSEFKIKFKSKIKKLEMLGKVKVK